MAARVNEFYLQVLKVSLMSERSERVRDTFSTRREKFYNSTVFASRGCFVNEISNQPIVCLSEKRYCNWVIMLVTMATAIKLSSHVKNHIFTAPSEDTIFIVSSLRTVKI